MTRSTAHGTGPRLIDINVLHPRRGSRLIQIRLPAWVMTMPTLLRPATDGMIWPEEGDIHQTIGGNQYNGIHTNHR